MFCYLRYLQDLLIRALLELIQICDAAGATRPWGGLETLPRESSTLEHCDTLRPIYSCHSFIIFT